MKIPSQYESRIVVTPTGCWEWTGWTNNPRRGKFPAYGMLKIGGRNRVAHRYFYELNTGIDPGENHVHHKCANTLCVNPDHLEMLDIVSHSLLHSALDKVNIPKKERSTCRNGHEWTLESTAYDPEGYRVCKECLHIADEKHRRSKGIQPYFERTHCPQGHEYAGDNLLINAEGYKVCRTCNREKMRTFRAKREPKGLKTHCKNGHPFAGDNLYIDPKGKRVCRTCIREAQARSQAKKKTRLKESNQQVFSSPKL